MRRDEGELCRTGLDQEKRDGDNLPAGQLLVSLSLSLISKDENSTDNFYMFYAMRLSGQSPGLA
jgi:hypothetical protein